MESGTPFLEVGQAIVEAGGTDLTKCFQCATCTGSCPWGYVDPLNMRQLIHTAQLGFEGYEGNDLWKCTTCGTCEQRCPRGVRIIDIVRSIRMIIGESGLIPQSLRAVLGATQVAGNPWNGARSHRNQWAAALGVPRFDRAVHEYLLFPCCMPSYDPRTRRIAEAVVKVLREGEVAFGVLDEEESCCGEALRKAGDEQLFQTLREGNAALFDRYGVRKIVVLSPHCYHAFKVDYAAHHAGVQVTHAVELVAALLLLGKLQLSRALDAVVTYHDPCYLGRHQGVFDAPRNVLRAIPGAQVVEMIRNRDSALCCGGGGGRMWMETKFGERFSDLRVPEALAVGASIIATACPYCTNMLEDSRLNLNHEDAIVVRDVIELVAEAIV